MDCLPLIVLVFMTRTGHATLKLVYEKGFLTLVELGWSDLKSICNTIN